MKFSLRKKSDPNYGAIPRDIDNQSDTSSLSSSRTSISNDFFRAWRNERSSSIIQRTESEARWRGAKRHFSSVISTAGSLQSLLDNDRPDVKWSWRRRLKVIILTSVCLIITVLLLFLPEQELTSNVIEIKESVPLLVSLDKIYGGQDGYTKLRLLEVILTGSFAPEDFDFLVAHKLTVTLSEVFNSNTTESQSWTLGVVDELEVEQSERSNIFDIGMVNWNEENVSLIFETNANFSVPLVLQTRLLSNLVNLGIVFGAIILIVMYILILFEITHRTISTMLSATIAIAVLAVLAERPTLEEILSWIDIETLALLFSMMVMVSIISETGVFDYIGYWAFKVSKGKLWPLIGTLCLTTALISAFLDNVTTILLMTPVIIQLCESMKVEPKKILIANVVFSNIGGAATAVGDPPNVLIASDASMVAGGVTFAVFTLHMSICVLIVIVVAFAQLRLMYGKQLSTENESPEVRDLQREIMIWNKTCQSMSVMSREEALVKQAVEMKIAELMSELKQLEIQQSSSAAMTSNHMDILTLQGSHTIKNKTLLIQSGVVLTVTIILFFLSNFPLFNLSLGWTALLGSLTLLILTDKTDVETILSRVEWSTLIFFACLFVVMEALEELGLLSFIGQLVQSVIEGVSEEYQLTVAIVMIVWISGLASAFIDNIPFTTMMIPIVVRLSEDDLGLPLQPLAWSLALGACLGGNGTLIGASANVVCAGIAEQHGYKFSFIDFFKVGFPITIVSLIVATVYLLICHVVIGWNGT